MYLYNLFEWIRTHKTLFFFYIQNLHSNIKSSVAYIYIYVYIDMPGKKTIKNKKCKKEQ